MALSKSPNCLTVRLPNRPVLLGAMVAALVFYPMTTASAGPLDIEIGARDVASTPASQGTLFISPNGGGNQSGDDPSNPRPFEDGHLKPHAGDVVFFMGGVYPFTPNGVHRYDLYGGTASRPVIYESYPGQTAIFDGSALDRHDSVQRKQGLFRLPKDHVILRNLEVRNMPEAGLQIFGSYNIVEGCTFHDNGLTGLQIYNWYSTEDDLGSHNVLRDNILHDNSDAGLSGGSYANGGNADGISISCGVDNLIEHNTVYGNSDDGIDTWQSVNSTVEYNLVYDQGRANGDGNGIKLGGNPGSPLGNGAIARHNISYGNTNKGVNTNDGEDVWIEYNTSFDNKLGYKLYTDTILRSNIADQNVYGPVSDAFQGEEQTNNSWQIRGTVTFISTDPASPDFLRPVAGSRMVGIGAYSTVDVGDFDSDGDVDGADFLTWQRGESPIPWNSSALDVWQTNIGATASAATPLSMAVPEPASFLLGFTVFACGLLRNGRSITAAFHPVGSFEK